MMMLFASPLPDHAVTKEYHFSDGLSIKRLPEIDWRQAAAKGYLSQHDFENFKNVQFWLCGEWDIPQAAGYSEMRTAVIAVQILCPIGHHGICLAFERRSSTSLINTGIDHETALAPALEGRLRELEDAQVELLGTVFLRLRNAFDQRIMRIVNPANLLFEGLRAANDYISPLLWTAGMDMLLMGAGTVNNFASRACALLGRTTFVFPPDYGGRQLKYTVEELVRSIYTFRSLTAHGQDVGANYLLREDLEYVGTTFKSHISPLARYELLGGAAASLLCGALRKVLLENLEAEVASSAVWRKRLAV